MSFGGSVLKRVVLQAACAAIVAGWASPAWAQEDVLPKTTIMGGYSFMVDRSWQERLPLGWVAALSQRISDRVSIVGEASGSYGKFADTNFTIERYAFLGGVKWQSSGAEGLVVFLQGLAGLSRQAGDVGILNGFLLQPGGGVDLRVTERMSFRAFADYRWLHEDGVRWNQYRAGGGVVINLRR